MSIHYPNKKRSTKLTLLLSRPGVKKILKFNGSIFKLHTVKFLIYLLKKILLLCHHDESLFLNV